MLVIWWRKYYDAKISEIGNKCVITADYNKFTKNANTEMIEKWKYFRKTNIADQVKSSELNKKVAILATKAELKAEEDKITKIQAFGSI